MFEILKGQPWCITICVACICFVIGWIFTALFKYNNAGSHNTHTFDLNINYNNDED